jgi:membrane protein implicated in regulation of membrane protease activity
MPWWGWISVGTLLLAGELFVVDADFYLVFLGFSAIVVGFLDVAGLGGPAWLEWLVFAALALASTMLFRQRIYLKLRPPGGPVSDSVVGEWVVLRDAIAPGALGRAELRGTLWEARNVGNEPLAPGARARVESLEGLVLNLRTPE